MALTQLTKIDGGGISTTSDYRVGVITASKFVGPFDGSGGNFSGVVTATNGVFSGNISAVDGNFSGNVTIGGTLTYEDVTNIDSVGIITTQKDIHVGAGVSAIGVGTFSGLDISGDIDVDGHTNLDNVNIAGVTTFSGVTNHSAVSNFAANIVLTDGYVNIQPTINSATSPVLLVRNNTQSYPTIQQFSNTNAQSAIIQWNTTGQSGAGNFIFRTNLSGNEEFARFTKTGNFNLSKDLDVDGHTNLDNVSIAGVTTHNERVLIRQTGGTTSTNVVPLEVQAYRGDSTTGITTVLFEANGLKRPEFILNNTHNGNWNNSNGQTQHWRMLWRAPLESATTDDVVELKPNTSITGSVNSFSIKVTDNTNGLRHAAYFSPQYQSFYVNNSFVLSMDQVGLGITDSIYHYLDENTKIRFPANDTITAETAGNEVLRITSDRKVGINRTSPARHLHAYAAGAGFVAKFEGSYSYSAVEFADTGTTNAPYIGSNSDHFTIATGGNNERLRITSAGDVGIGYDSPTVKLHIREAASGYSGTYDNRYHCTIEDDAEAYYGIYVPNNGYGGIRFHRAGGGASATSAVGYIDCYMANEEMHYYCRGSGTTGKHIFSTAGYNRLKIDENGHLTIGTAAAAGGRLYFESTSGAAQYIASGGTNNRDLIIASSAGTKLQIGADGHILPGAAGTQDLGSTSKEFRNLYLGDVGSVYFGEGQDVRAYYDPTGSASFTIDSTAGYMYINSDALRLNSKTSGWSYLRGDKSDGVVKLYKSNSEKLATSDTGITVTGEVAASQDYPNLKPTLDLNFTATANLDPRVTFTRIGSGSYYGRDGLLKFAAHNEPRFDHDPITRECKGLLIEEQRENWAYNSYRANNDYGGGGATFADMGYNMINNAVTINDFGTAPDGTNTATKMYPASSGSARGIELQMSLSSTGNWTNSIYVKAAGHTGWIALYGVNGGARAYFNPSTGAKGSSGGTSAPSSDKYGIQDVGNGWYRIHITINLTTTGGTEYHYIYFGDSDNSTTVTASGTNGILMWGLQVEKGDYPTSYIRTDSNHRVIRGADQCFINGQDLTNFYNQSEGTIIADYKVIQGDPEIFYLSNNTSSKRIGLYEAGSSQTRFIIGNSGTQADTTDSAGTTVGDNIKSSGAYKLNDIVAAKNGVISSTDSSATIPDGIDRAWIGGYYDGTVQGVLGLRRLIYYPQRLPNSQLVTLTS